MNKIIKPEVIDLNAGWYGGGFSFKLEKNKSGTVFSDYVEMKVTPVISDQKIIRFWENVEKLGVWNWKKKYPYWKQKYEPLLDGCSWELKLRNREGRAKYCSGYESFPRNFKKLVKELNELFESDIDF